MPIITIIPVTDHKWLWSRVYKINNNNIFVYNCCRFKLQYMNKSMFLYDNNWSIRTEYYSDRNGSKLFNECTGAENINNWTRDSPVAGYHNK